MKGSYSTVWRVRRHRIFFLCTLVTGPRRSLSLELSDTRVYEPQIRSSATLTVNVFGLLGIGDQGSGFGVEGLRVRADDESPVIVFGLLGIGCKGLGCEAVPRKARI